LLNGDRKKKKKKTSSLSGRKKKRGKGSEFTIQSYKSQGEGPSIGGESFFRFLYTKKRKAKKCLISADTGGGAIVPLVATKKKRWNNYYN